MTTEIKLDRARVRKVPREEASPPEEAPVVEIDHLTFRYGEKAALHDICMAIPGKKITAFIGPSGCGKSTLLRCLNRMNDLVEGVRIEGQIRIRGGDVHDPHLDVTDLRRRVGMVFQKKAFTIVIVTHNMQQAARVSDLTGFLFMGKLVEFGPTDKLFTNPAFKQTEEYITGRFG